MPKLPVLQDKDVIRVLKKLDFEYKRQKGSHRVFKHAERGRIVVPMHSGKDIPKGTLKGMLRDIGIEVEELIELLK